jgi:hypothetical protein
LTLVATEELLIASDLLAEHNRDDRAAIEKAIGRLIELLIAAEQGH